MRLVRVNVPAGQAAAVAQLAYDVGIDEVTIFPLELRARDGRVKPKEAVDIATATPTAKAFVDALVAAPFFNRHEFTVNVRQPRTILSRQDVSELTFPLVEPGSDLLEESWQFCHITGGMVGRVLLGGALLGFGLLKDNLLLIVAGLMFLPLLPVVLGMAFGARTSDWQLVGRAVLALVVGLALTAVGSAIAGFLTGGPILYNDFLGVLPSLAISSAVGVAAALATADDVGRRELIGLAAAAQIAIVPAWFGLVISAGSDDPQPVLMKRGLTLFMNLCAIFLTSLGAYMVLRFRATPIASHEAPRTEA